MINLVEALPRLMPFAVAWVEAQEAEILAHGRALSPNEIALAHAVGVRDASLVRLKFVAELPLPSHTELRAAANQTGLLGPGMAGITFGHGIFVRHGFETPRLISHELRHVHQYEDAGSIAAFLPVYLQQIVSVGYERAPFEIDARRFERDSP